MKSSFSLKHIEVMKRISTLLCLIALKTWRASLREFQERSMGPRTFVVSFRINFSLSFVRPSLDTFLTFLACTVLACVWDAVFATPLTWTTLVAAFACSGTISTLSGRELLRFFIESWMKLTAILTCLRFGRSAVESGMPGPNGIPV